MLEPMQDWSQTDEIMLETASNGCVTWLNAHARVVLPSGLEGKPLAEIVTDVEPTALTAWLKETIPGQKTRHRTVEMSFRAGQAQVTLHVGRCLDGPTRVRVSLTDESSPINASLLRALQELRYALDQATIVAITDRKGVIVHVNDQFCAISGYSCDELLGQTHRIVRSDQHDRSFFKEMWATIGRGQVWRGEICNRAKSGDLYWVNTTIVPLTDAQGRPQRYLAIRSDITQAKRAEAALRDAVSGLKSLNLQMKEEQHRRVRTEKLSSVGMLAAGVAHEINNPLAGAITCVRSLRDGTVSEGRRDLYFETVLDSLSRISGTVRSLLDYARPIAPANISVSLADVVEANVTLLSSVCQKKCVSIELGAMPPEAQTRGDRGQLAQATMNVLMNACYAAPQGSTIKVSISIAEERVAIHIRDQGAGIPQSTLQRIFDPFFSTKPEGEGTGLGLSVTQSLIEAHGGHIDVETSDQGTLFSLWLPRHL